MPSSFIFRSPRLGNFSGIFAAAVIGLAPRLAAQPPPPPAVDAAAQAAERLQREEQDREREQFRRERETSSGAMTVETPATTLLPKVAVPHVGRREIKKLLIEGAEHMRPAFRAQLEHEFEDRSLGVEEVEQLLTAITRHYVLRGYVTTRAYIPEQDLATGTLRVLVVEGRIERLQGGGVARNIFPAAAGDLLNLRDLEQGIDNLNRLPSHQATLDLLPGTQPGETIVGVRDDPARRWRGNVSADNTGSAGTGKDQVSASFALDNPLGLGDAISVSQRQSVPYREGHTASESTTGSLAIPWGYQTFTLGGSLSSYSMSFAAPSGAALPFDGSSDSLFARVDRVLYRGPSARIGGYANLRWQSSRNYLMHSLIDVSSRDAAALDLGLNFSAPLAGGFATLDGSVSHGLAIFGGAGDAAGLPDFAPHSDFTDFKFNATWSRGFTLRSLAANFSTALNTQYSPRVLYGTDQLTIGGIYAVRGFDTTNLAGDSGVVWRNDFSLTLPLAKQKDGRARVVLHPYVAFDAGHAWSSITGLPGFAGPAGTLLGGTVGATLTIAGCSADVFYAQSLDRPASLTREAGHVYFRLNAPF